MEDAETRRKRAVRAALSVAKRLGMEADEPNVIKDSNNTIVHLSPAAVVAKVGTTTLRLDVTSVLERELNIGRYLAEHGAPIPPPISSVSPGPYFEDGTILTLWEYIAPADSTIIENQLGDMLTAFHRAFTHYPDALPDFMDNLDRAKSFLEEAEKTPQLPQADRSFLLEIAASIEQALGNAHFSRHPLHGDPHLDGNIVWSKDGPLLVDFEAACLGSYEWDLTSLERALVPYPSADRNLLRTLSTMRSLTVSTWCWTQYGRAPEVDEAAHVHLNLLREKASG